MESELSIVEAAYQRGLDVMSTQQRMARLESYLAWTRNLIARQVRKRLGDGISDERVRWEVALWM